MHPFFLHPQVFLIKRTLRPKHCTGCVVGEEREGSRRQEEGAAKKHFRPPPQKHKLRTKLAGVAMLAICCCVELQVATIWKEGDEQRRALLLFVCACCVLLRAHTRVSVWSVLCMIRHPATGYVVIIYMLV
jgi:hypothetical protein